MPTPTRTARGLRGRQEIPAAVHGAGRASAANSRAISTTPRVVRLRLETSQTVSCETNACRLPFLAGRPCDNRQAPNRRTSDLRIWTRERLAPCFAVANLGNWTWDVATCFVTFSDRAAESSGFLRSGSGVTAANRAVLWLIRRSAGANSRQKSWEDSAFVNTQSLDCRQQVFGREF